MITSFLGLTDSFTSYINVWMDENITQSYMQAIYHGMHVSTLYLGQMFS